MCGSSFSPAALAFDVKQIELRIGYSAGGGYDRFGRLVARHLGRFLPGNPEIIPQNMPGGGSLKLTKLVAESNVTDGSLIAMANPSMATISIMRPDRASFDPSDLTWIGSLTKTSSLCVTSKSSGIRTLEDFASKSFVAGATGKSSATYQFAALAKNMMGSNFKIVTGYPGGNDILLAMDRGEVQARCGFSWSSLRKSAIKGQLNMVGQMAIEAPAELRQVPLFLEKLDDDDRKLAAAKFILEPLSFSYPLFAPPGLDDSTRSQLREAYSNMTKDTEFVAEAKKLGLDVIPTNGETLQEKIGSLNAVDLNLVKLASEMIK